MSRPILFVVVLALTLLQYTVLERHAPFGATPNIVFLVLYFRFTRTSLQEALTWTFVFGVIFDVLALDALGAHALAMIPMVLAAQPFRVRPYLINPLSTISLLVAAALFNKACLHQQRASVELNLINPEMTIVALLALSLLGWIVLHSFMASKHRITSLTSPGNDSLIKGAI